MGAFLIVTSKAGQSGGSSVRIGAPQSSKPGTSLRRVGQEGQAAVFKGAGCFDPKLDDPSLVTGCILPRGFRALVPRLPLAA